MLFDKLRQIEERSNALARLLADPSVLSQPAEYARLRKEHADTLEIVERFREYRAVLERLSEARHILSEGGDRELQELAQSEVDELQGRQAVLEAELTRLLLPRDPNDDLQRIWILRKVLNEMDPVQAMELLIDRLSKAKSNEEFLATITKNPK